MMPKLLPRRVRPHFTAPAALLLGAMSAIGALGLLAACGVGVGGTGTGETALAAFGAQRVAICTSALAPVAACVGGAATPSAPASFFADGSPSSRHLARLEGDDLVLELRCQRVRFVGTLGSAPGLGLRYYGELQSDVAGAPPALASVQATLVGSGGSAQLTLQVFDAGSGAYAAPLSLAPVAGPTALPAAPC